MKKVLYSLMLNDSVVREIDILAHKLGTNRSNLVNNILAEYVNCITPEKNISNLIDLINQCMSTSNDIVPLITTSPTNISLSSSLNYKYRPTIKYSVDLYQSFDYSFGKLTVIFRTQSQFLLNKIASFCGIWKQIEDLYLRPNIYTDIDYALYPERFTRSFIVPQLEFSNEELANAISNYVSEFDSLLKGYLQDQYSVSDIESKYLSFIKNVDYII